MREGEKKKSSIKKAENSDLKYAQTAGISVNPAELKSLRGCFQKFVSSSSSGAVLGIKCYFVLFQVTPAGYVGLVRSPPSGALAIGGSGLETPHYPQYILHTC